MIITCELHIELTKGQDGKVQSLGQRYTGSTITFSRARTPLYRYVTHARVDHAFIKWLARFIRFDPVHRWRTDTEVAWHLHLNFTFYLLHASCGNKMQWVRIPKHVWCNVSTCSRNILASFKNSWQRVAGFFGFLIAFLRDRNLLRTRSEIIVRSSACTDCRSLSTAMLLAAADSAEKAPEPRASTPSAGNPVI